MNFSYIQKLILCSLYEHTNKKDSGIIHKLKWDVQSPIRFSRYPKQNDPFLAYMSDIESFAQFPTFGHFEHIVKKWERLENGVDLVKKMKVGQQLNLDNFLKCVDMNPQYQYEAGDVHFAQGNTRYIILDKCLSLQSEKYTIFQYLRRPHFLSLLDEFPALHYLVCKLGQTTSRNSELKIVAEYSLR